MHVFKIPEGHKMTVGFSETEENSGSEVWKRVCAEPFTMTTTVRMDEDAYNKLMARLLPKAESVPLPIVVEGK